MRQAAIYYKEYIAGILTETDEGEYHFEYTPEYVVQHPKEPISVTMPVQTKSYTDKRLFPFFEGLIPEGWLLDIASKSWKINPNDRMGLLLACCKNCIGAVSVQPIVKEEENE